MQQERAFIIKIIDKVVQKWRFKKKVSSMIERKIFLLYFRLEESENYSG